MTGVQTCALPIYERFELLCRGFESPEWDLNFAPRGIRIHNSKIRIALFDLQSSAFTFAKGFESVTRRFESPSLVLHLSRLEDSNRCVGDSNPFFSSLFMFFMRDSNRLNRDSNRSSWICLLEFGFESLHEGFESPSLVWTLWNVDSNRYGRDSNRLRQSALFGMWIRIAIGGIRICLKSSRIEEFVEGFESPC